MKTVSLQSQIGSSEYLKLAPVRLAMLGNLEARLAQSNKEIAEVLEMRAKIFQLPAAINVDRIDGVCDHLIVVDNSISASKNVSNIVGTYRLVLAKQAAQIGGFYSSSEFNIAPMLEQNANLSFLEFGRSCVLPDYRGKRTIELLWAGSWAYIKKHEIDVLFGCASFSGIDPEQHKEALSFLYHYAAAEEKFDANAMPSFKGKLKLLAKAEIDPKRAIRNLPPMIKGYLRVGAQFSTEFAIDKEFNTIDVFTILPVKNIDKRYLNYYGVNGGKHC